MKERTIKIPNIINIIVNITAGDFVAVKTTAVHSCEHNLWHTFGSAAYEMTTKRILGVIFGE